MNDLRGLPVYFSEYMPVGSIWLDRMNGRVVIHKKSLSELKRILEEINAERETDE